MRVAVVTVDSAHAVETARTRRIERVARQLVAEDHEVVVCCDQWWDGDVDTFDHDGIEYHRVTSDRSVRRFATRLPFRLRSLQPDLIHASYWPVGVAASASMRRLVGGVPAIVDWYGDREPDLELRRTRWAIDYPERLIAPSRHVRTRLREWNADPATIELIPESIDMDRIRTTQPVDDVDIVTARHLDDAANVDVMLLGLAELRDRDWRAVVIGEGPARARYEQKAAELRIDDRVAFPGELDRDERLAHYRGAHVFVQTAEHCPFAGELLWALAAGCVGIVDYQEDSAAHELVEHLDRGFRTTDPEELSQAITDAGELDALTENERFAEYDHDRVLERYLELYADLGVREE